eukprot:4587400-Pleurochrysis_carterae.AAC.1
MCRRAQEKRTRPCVALSRPRTVESGAAVSVVGGALLRVGQRLVRLGNLLEHVLGSAAVVR